MTAAVAAVLLTLLFPLSPGSGDAGCVDAHVIGVRGSGQAPGFGDQAAPVVESVVETLAASGRTVDTVALDYPALSLADSFGLALFTGEYDDSVRAGASALLASLASTATRCPRTEFVLVGYSQGAQVIKTALADAPPLRRITGIVLLADPTRDHRQAGIVRLGDPAVERPGAFGALPLPDHLRAVTLDVCAPGDGICERGRSDLRAHTGGYGTADTDIAPAFAAELADRLRRPPRM